MFVPAMYRETDPGRLLAVIRQYPLAILITSGPSVPHATHLPIIPGRDAVAGEPALIGRTLLGHMNRANPQWASLRSGALGKLVFSGPHSYVTPALYEPGPAAPTWDFVAVHLEGTIEVIDDFAQTLNVTRETVAVFEGQFGSGWQDGASLDYFRKIGRAVGAFRFRVTSADGMFKLSQEKTASERHGICRHMLAQQRGPAHDLGLLLRDRTPLGVSE
jgi:transcriptional regulator